MLLALVLAPIAAGCGSNKPTTFTSAAASAAHGPGAAAFQYARCIRAHGVPSFPDPQVTTGPGSGSIRQAVPPSAGLSPKFAAAQKACRGILPAIREATRGEQQARRQVFLAFARCLRSHGIAGFPDPDHDGQITRQMISSAGVDLHSNELLRAGATCVGVTHGAITMAQIRAAIDHRH